MSGLRTSAIAGIGVNWRPLVFTVAGEQASAEEQGEEVTRPRLKGLEGGPGRTKTALKVGDDKVRECLGNGDVLLGL